jgi:membrane peptidoglycan carboxypeptidase
MQVSLDQLINVIMAKLEGLEMSLEDLKFRTNIALRVLYKNELLTEDNLVEAIKDEFKANTELEGKAIELPDEKAKEMSKDILNWIKIDLEEMKKKMKEYEEQLKQLMQQADTPDISVAPPDLLNQLDQMKKSNKGNNGGLIL